MKLTDWLLGLFAVGVLLFATSFVWPTVFGPRQLWSDEQAREHAQVAGELHQLGHERAHATAQHGKTDPQHDEAALKQARQRYERTDAELRRAQTRGHFVVWMMKGAGVFCMVVGAAGFFVLRYTVP